MTDVAQQALDLGRKNEGEIAAHEAVCAERYGNILSKIADIMGILKWAGGAAFTLIMALLAWSLVQQINANTSARIAAETKIDLLQKQIVESRQAPAVPAPVPQPSAQ